MAHKHLSAIFYSFSIKDDSFSFSLFHRRIRDALLLRENALLNRNLFIRIDPRIAEIFKPSVMIASKLILQLLFCSRKGRIHKLLRKYLPRKEKEVKEAVSSVSSLACEIDELKKELMMKEGNKALGDS